MTRLLLQVCLLSRFEEVVKTLVVFGSKSFSSQAFNSRKAVSVKYKFLMFLSRPKISLSQRVYLVIEH